MLTCEVLVLEIPVFFMLTFFESLANAFGVQRWLSKIAASVTLAYLIASAGRRRRQQPQKSKTASQLKPCFILIFLI
jgi:hypothetical protein